ncbi:hypothetical protein NSU_0534 [Novosphingobium pentaromativorans US6-1]|uniref:FAS1-like dehydratase domain-containing protein n=1 Tax=Novosphingobium pentaromativorans US6-1 TaxID=1088721 RepID=G6E863_9SPHN|nr:MaoC family dehydratase N-terminal domain-containing protein [Novosphingobium pentaromativorans]EHJ62403.1 hypothetical protein NSU_0534 [Novosphingobium pentaromativorans US6-1]
MAEDGLIRNRITDESVDLMRRRIGYPNPTVRTGAIDDPWNMVATADAVRRFSICIGDDNPLFTKPEYAAGTRWGQVIAPPGFEKSMGINRSPVMDPVEAKETSKALRGIQLYHSGGENFYYTPIVEGTKLYRSRWVKKVEEKNSEFAGRSVIVSNGIQLWDESGTVAVDGIDWFVHTERGGGDKTRKKEPRPKEEPAFYSDEDLEEIEAAYDAEYVRGADTLYLEDVKIGQKLPRMVKGPLTITDLINIHMGAGWFLYGNWPNRLAYENRKKLRGFYNRDEFNAWDTIQRVHWDKDLAKKVGLPMMYDIGPMRQLYVSHYLTNYAGDDAWIHRIRFEFRRFNYMGDVTWLEGEITDVRDDAELGPLIEVSMTGTSQRGVENIRANATILVSSRTKGKPRLPTPPPLTPHRS